MKFISLKKKIGEELGENSLTIWTFYCWKKNYRKKQISESIKKIKDSGDKDKLKYVKNLYRYYTILVHLNHIVGSHPILKKEQDETKVKYHCLDFYFYLKEHLGRCTKIIIRDIIHSIANDESLPFSYKYLMFRYNYEEYEEYCKEFLEKKRWPPF